MVKETKETLPAVVEGEIVETTPPVIEVRPNAAPSRSARIVERGLALLSSLARVGLRLLEAREEAAAVSQMTARRTGVAPNPAMPASSTPPLPTDEALPAGRGRGAGRGGGPGLGRGGRRQRRRRRGGL